MNVLSLFDGISCGQIALNRANVSYDHYYASEIDKHAIKVTQHRHPNTIQIGSVVDVRGADLPSIDLLMGGSPCQGFSSAGKQLNFNDPRSKLFFEFARLLNECQPKYFLLENVMMPQHAQDIMNSYLEVQPVEINSALVSAQHRRRLYWANFPITQPQDQHICLTSILENHQYPYPAAIRGRPSKVGKVQGRFGMTNYQQYLIVRKTHDKSNALTTRDKDNILTTLKSGRMLAPSYHQVPCRYYALREWCRLQTVPDTYFDGLTPDARAKILLGNAWTVDVIAHILQDMENADAKR